VSGSPTGRKAVTLPWLAPAADACVACADEPVNSSLAAGDPALVLHILRFGRTTASIGSNEWFGDAAVLESLATCIAHRPAHPAITDSDLGRTLIAIGRTASALAASLATDNRATAAMAALVAPLGWYALAASEPVAATPELADSLGRKLARRWQLPEWACDVISNLNSDQSTVDALGGNADLLAIVRASLFVAERQIRTLGIVRSSVSKSLQTAAENSTIRPVRMGSETPATANPLLGKLLRSVAANRRKTGYAHVPQLERENERLRFALNQAEARFQATMQDAKLTAVAELAAGAGHEINNPLAVISGHCQRLIAREQDPEARQSLGTVIRQTMRVHGILRGLMQFARPSKPHVEPVAIVPLVEDVVGELSDLTQERAVEVEVIAENDEVVVHADAAQIKTILHQLVRNALEAVGETGRVSVIVEPESTDGMATIAVEDSGPGPNADHLDHLFDPFFSGRDAGRGRGLGLPIAWRLATINGGTVRYDSQPSGPTRFILALPEQPVAAPAAALRKAG
jgi:two-component system NtrC family sensor kinase